MPIRVLDPRVAAQIAAGEVVERPASIVKELVENALDAGAGRISVSVRGGGIDEIVIQDDGAGIPADEIELAFARHATSKLSSADDLWAIHTLGFRGEALPSIAAIAQVSCVSRAAGAEVGTELRIAGGEVQSHTARGCSPGTTFTIRNLFYNIPVRRAFMKSPAAEAAAIAAIVTQYALAYPQVAFSFVRDGKRVLQTSGRSQLADVILELYGAEVARQMIELDTRAGNDLTEVQITGMVSAPTVSRSARDGMHITVNGRAILARGPIGAMIEQAYHTLLMKGRFPIVVLRIQVHPAAVDVNVHPTKSEVKFRQPEFVGQLLEQAVRAAVQEAVVIQGWEAEGLVQDAGGAAEPDLAAASEPAFTDDERAPALPQAMPSASLDYAPALDAAGAAETERAPAHLTPIQSTLLVDQTRYDEPSAARAPARLAEPSWRAPALRAGQDASNDRDDERELDDPYDLDDDRELAADAARRLAALEAIAERPRGPSAAMPALATPAPHAARPSQPQPEAAGPAPRLPELRALAQLAQTYLLTEGPDGALYLIDQHAAHERITYERLLAQHAAGVFQAQALLMPQPVALPPQARQTLLDAAGDIAGWGFVLTEADGGVEVQAMPSELALEALTTTLTDLASHLAGSGGQAPSARSDATLATLACHTSVRAGQTLTLVEQQALIDQLAGCEGPRTCPHGRPTLMVLTKHQLELQFGRLGA